MIIDAPDGHGKVFDEQGTLAELRDEVYQVRSRLDALKEEFPFSLGQHNALSQYLHEVYKRIGAVYTQEES